MDNKTMETDFLNDGQSLVFSQGLYGFESYTDFELLDSEYKPLMRLQSKQEKSLSFFVVNPFLFFPDYEIDVDDKSLGELGVTSPEDVYVLAIITVSKTKPPSITANLQGPIVINKKNNKARQVVLDDFKWSTKHDLIPANSTMRSSPC